MRFVLSKRELDGLVPKKHLDLARAAIDFLRDLFIRDCVNVSGSKRQVCDGCPLDYLNEANPHRPPRELAKTLCPKGHEYTK